MENKNGGDNFTLRMAAPQDAPLVLWFIKQLAVYEKMEDRVCATEADIQKSLAEKYAEVLIGEYEGEPAAFALFFSNYSTFLGRQNLYLEDLFVRPEYRQKGLGRAMFAALAGIAEKRGCQRVDWCCLNWNQSAIDFYKSIGAAAMDEWTTFRLEGEALRKVAPKSTAAPLKDAL